MARTATRSSSDDWAWAAAELWLATGDTGSAARRGRLGTADAIPLDGFDFDRIAAAAALDLALHGGRGGRPRGAVAAADRLLALQAAQPWGQPYAPVDGWDWGSNGRLLNNLVVLAVADELTGAGGI